FQKQNGLTPDGIIGPKTERALQLAAGIPTINRGASTVPPTKMPAYSLPGYTFYVNIDLGIRYNSSGRSFHIIPKTGIYIPQNFSPAQPTDLIIYLHGFKMGSPPENADIEEYW